MKNIKRINWIEELLFGFSSIFVGTAIKTILISLSVPGGVGNYIFILVLVYILLRFGSQYTKISKKVYSLGFFPVGLLLASISTYFSSKQVLLGIIVVYVLAAFVLYTFFLLIPYLLKGLLNKRKSKKDSSAKKILKMILSILILIIIAVLSILGGRFVYYDSITHYKTKTVDGVKCMVIEPTIAVYEFQEVYKYILAESEDLSSALESGEITNLSFEKKMDSLKAKMPKKFIDTDITIYSYNEEENKYLAYINDELPLGKCTVSYLHQVNGCTNIRIHTSNIPDFNFTLNEGDVISATITNRDSTNPDAFYYQVVKFTHEGREYVDKNFCS